MRLALTGRNVDVTPALRQLVTRRLAKLGRLLNDSVVSAQVVLHLEKFRHEAELVVHTRGDHVLRGHGQDGTWAASIGQAAEKVAQQAARVKGKWEGRKRRVIDTKPEDVEPDEGPAIDGEVGPARRAGRHQPSIAPRIVRVRRTAAKPMTVEDAALGVHEAPGSIVVFRDADANRVRVLVRRGDGHLGLIDPDA